MRKLIFLMVSALAFLTSVQADELPENRYHFSVSAKGQADNDWMTVVLSVQHQDKDLAHASSAVNKEMAWALDLLKGEQEIKSITEGYRSNPIYTDKGRSVRAWQVTQQLRLQSANFELLTEKLKGLQERLAIQQMKFSVKPDTRELLIEELLVTALAHFRSRAKLITEQMDAQDYTAINITINTSDNRNHYRPEMAMRSMVSDGAAPAVSSGESDVSVGITAAIELQY